VNQHPQIGLQAFDVNSGEIVWQADQDVNTYFRDCGPSVAYGKVVVPSNRGKMLVYGSAKASMPRLIPPFTEEDYEEAMIAENSDTPKKPKSIHYRKQNIYVRYFTHLANRYRALQRFLGHA
jgi:hypothetical protein